MKASLRTPFFLWLFLLIVWSVFRFLVRLPEEIDEFIIKPIVWLGLVVWVVRFLEKRSLTTIGWSGKNLFNNLYLGWGLGAFFAFEGMLANAIKYRGLLFFPMGLSIFDLVRLLVVSLVTGFTEETFFRGYIFTRLEVALKSEMWANFLSALAFAFIHLPIAYFVLQYDMVTLFSYEFILLLLGMANGFIFSKTRTVAAPTISHALWNLSVILFK